MCDYLTHHTYLTSYVNATVVNWPDPIPYSFFVLPDKLYNAVSNPALYYPLQVVDWVAGTYSFTSVTLRPLHLHAPQLGSTLT